MKIKKFVALLLIISMLLGMVVTVSAATESNLPVLNNHKILYSEDFNSGISKWSSNAKSRFTGNTGKLVYRNTVGNNFGDYIDNEEFIVSNGYVQFDMKAASPVDFAAKVRAKGETSILICFDYISDKVRITKVVGGGKNILLKEGTYKLTNNTKYTVNIGLSGGDIVVKINNNEVVKAEVNDIKEGCVGFTAKKGQYEIDDLIIYEVEGEAYKEIAVTEKTTKIYVAPDGNDETGNGSYEKPFATIEKAKEMTFRAKESYLPVEVIFKEGEYRIKEVTVFDENSSGTEYAPITYRAEEGAKVEFNGATVIDHTKFKPVTDENIRSRLYEHVQDKVLQLDLAEQGFTKKDLDFVSVNKEFPPEGVVGRDERRELETINFFLNDRKQEISRWPNGGFEIIKKCTRGSIKAADRYNGGRIFFTNSAPLRWTQAKDAYVEGLMFYEWYLESIPIKEINVEEFSIDLYRYSNAGLRSEHEYCVKNLLEEIDRPGEWYVDFDTMTLYYYPEKELTADDVFEVSTLKQAFITLTNASHLNFKDITFKNSAGLIQTVYDEEGKYVDFGIYFHDNWIKNFGGGIEIDYQTHDIIIDGCTFKDINGTGIRAVGWKSQQRFDDVKNIYIQNNNFYRCSDNAIRIGTGNADTLTQGNFNVVNNFFYENNVISANERQSGFTVKNNLFIRVFNTTIYCRGAEYTVDNNEISYGSYGMSDMGAIYAGRNMMQHGSSISRNLITNYGPAPKELRSFPCGGIYLDDAVGGITMTQNMSNARSKNYQSTGLIYGYGPDITYYGNVSLDANRGFILQNRSGSTTIPLALAQPKERFNNGKEIWINKYPQVERMLDWLAYIDSYDPQIKFYDNLSTNNDIATHKANFDKTPYVTGRIEDAHIIDDLSIYVDPENYDYRLKMEAVEKYNLPETLPNEENLDIDSIGIQRELKYNQDLVEFEITYPVNGQTTAFSNKVGLSWQTSDAAVNYEYTVATDEEFKNIVASGVTMDNYAEITDLMPNSSYYAKVKAVSISRKNGYEVENKNGVIKFTTTDKDNSETTLLEVVVKKLEETIKTIDEGTEIGKAKPGTIAKGKQLAADAKNLVVTKPSQEIIDAKASEVVDFIENTAAYYYSGFAPIGFNQKSEWISDNQLESIEAKNKTVVFKAPETHECSVTLNKIQPNTNVVKFKYSISSVNGWHAWGLRRQNTNTPIYMDDSYYVIVKKDIFELQKKGNIVQTIPNNGIIEAGKEYEIVLGAVNVEGGINVYVEVNGQVLFDYLDTDELLSSPGMFGVHIQKGATMTITDATDVQPEYFVPSDKILNKTKVYNLEYEGFKVVKGAFEESVNNNNPDNTRELVSSEKGAEAIWTITEKGDTTYEIYYYHHSGAGNDNNVEIIVTGKDGTYKTSADMSAGEEGYKRLGTFKFTADNAAIGITSVIFRGSGNGKLPISTVYIREVSGDHPDMLKPENQK